MGFAPGRGPPHRWYQGGDIVRRVTAHLLLPQRDSSRFRLRSRRRRRRPVAANAGTEGAPVGRRPPLPRGRGPRSHYDPLPSRFLAPKTSTFGFAATTRTAMQRGIGRATFSDPAETHFSRRFGPFPTHFVFAPSGPPGPGPGRSRRPDPAETHFPRVSDRSAHIWFSPLPTFFRRRFRVCGTRQRPEGAANFSKCAIGHSRRPDPAETRFPRVPDRSPHISFSRRRFFFGRRFRGRRYQGPGLPPQMKPGW